MYVRMITYHLKQDVGRNEATGIYHEIVDILQEQEGFEGSALLVDEDAHAAISLTYWTDAEHAGKAGERVLPVLFERTTDLSERPPEISGYDVLEHHIAGR